jgi:hypothetical protein
MSIEKEKKINLDLVIPEGNLTLILLIELNR